MLLSKPKPGMAVLISPLVLTLAAILLCDSGQAEEPKLSPSKNAPVADGGDKTSAATPMEPKIEMTVSKPEIRKPDLDLPDFTFWELKVQYKNESKEEIVLSPFVSVKVYDAGDKPVENDVLIGAGVIGEDWMPMIEKQFFVIPPGKSREVVVNLADNRSPGRTIGWKFQKSGTYRIVVTYNHSRKAFAADYVNDRFFFTTDALQKAKLPGRLWNRAVEMERSVEVKLTVKP
ncbi:MAG TPA: hypothetical protein VG097_20945 [Gemmata sp.]|nr:hypothetical protein [Gemmata sp.]